MYTPLGLKKQDGYIACHHHHQGQNKPHQKTITHPHATPRAFLKIPPVFGWGRGSCTLPTPPSQKQTNRAQRAPALRASRNESGY